MKRIIILLFLLCKMFSSFCQVSFFDIDSLLDSSNRLFRQGNCEEAIPPLMKALDNSTNESEIQRITDKIMNCYFATNQFDKFFDIIDYGQKRGVVYRFPSFFKQSLDENRYAAMILKNDSILQIQKKKAKYSYELVLPEQYNKDLEYPLFFVLTKGIRTKKDLIDGYRSPRITNEFILVFMHSSDFNGTNFYQWHNKTERRPEIENVFNEVKNTYKIDNSKIIIGGMSNCGEMAIDMTFRGDFPIRGFIGFCPTNANISDDEISQNTGSGKKGIIVAGKNDKKFLSHSEAMHHQLSKNNFSIKYEIGDFGHTIPPNSYTYIDNAINYIFE